MNRFPDKKLKISTNVLISSNKIDKLKEAAAILNKEKSILLNLTNALKSDIKEKNKNYKELFLSKSNNIKINDSNKKCNKDEKTANITKKINNLLKKEEIQDDEYFSLDQEKYLEMTTEEKNQYGNRDLKETYKKMKLIGKGGCGIVWIGIDFKTQNQVAIKQICRKSAKGEMNYNIGKREIETLTNLAKLSKDLKEDYIIKLLDSYEDYQDLWLIFEKSGPTLNNLIFKIKGEFLNNERIYYIQKGKFFKKLFDSNLLNLKLIIKKISCFLKFISDNMIIHADLKPENILIELDEKSELMNIKIIDFGSSFDWSNPENFTSNTPEYLSPEINELLDKNASRINIAQFMKSLNPWAMDVWSLGVIILEIINGCPIWMNYKSKILKNQKSTYMYGLFATKGRQKIFEKQIEVVNSLESVLKHCFIEDCNQKELVLDLLGKMLNIDYNKRISPKQILEHSFLQ